MIGAKEVQTLYEVSPFGGEVTEETTAEELDQRTEEDIQRLRDLGMDWDEIAHWITPRMLKTFERLLIAGAPPMILPGACFMSGFRIGFLLGRGYIEE